MKNYMNNRIYVHKNEFSKQRVNMCHATTTTIDAITEILLLVNYFLFKIIWRMGTSTIPH